MHTHTINSTDPSKGYIAKKVIGNKMDVSKVRVYSVRTSGSIDRMLSMVGPGVMTTDGTQPMEQVVDRQFKDFQLLAELLEKRLPG